MSTNQKNDGKWVGKAAQLNELPEILILTDIAAYLRCSYTQAWRLVKRGRIQRFGFSRRVLVHRDHLQAFVREDGKLSNRINPGGETHQPTVV